MFVDYSNFKYTNASKSPDKGVGATNGVSHLEANLSKVTVFNLPDLNNLAITNYIRRDLEDKLWAKGLSPQEADKLIKDFLNSNKELVGKVSNLNKAVAEAKNTGNYDEVKKAQKDLEKSLRKREYLEKEVAKKLESRNDNKNRMEAKAQANSQKDKIFALINKEASKEARAAAFDPNLKGIRSELSDKLENINKNLKDFGKSFDELKNGKNKDFSKAEETLKALKDSVKDLGINPEWISKIENLNAALNDFKNGKNKDFSKVTQAKSDLENSIKDVIINQKITDKVDNLNQAVSETKLTGDFSKVEQALAELKSLSLDQKNESFNVGKNSDLQKSVKNSVNGTLVGNGLPKTEATKLTKNFSDIRKELNEKLFGNSNNNNNGLKDSTKKNALKLWVESAKQVPTGLQAKLDNYATNSHTRINSNVHNGTINEKATGMLTQKNPEWLKLVNDKIVAHNVGSAHLSEYDKIGFNQKNMKGYSDSFKFSTKLNNAVKDIKSGFVQFLTNTFSTGSYSPMKAEHGVKNINWIQPKERLI
ncbi:hypothetical protein Taiwan62_07710 [Helicobacter pylori]